MSTDIFFSDLDLDFIAHPFNKDISKKINEDAIARSIRNLILTNKNERTFNPNAGGNVTALLFEPLDIITVDQLRTRIIRTIEENEPRVKDVSVEIDVDYDESSFDCTIYFTPINNREQVSLNLYLKRAK